MTITIRLDRRVRTSRLSFARDRAPVTVQGMDQVERSSGHALIPRIGLCSDQRPAASMSALGHKQTFSDTLSNVRYWGQSGHWEVPDPESCFECPLLGVKML